MFIPTDVVWQAATVDAERWGLAEDWLNGSTGKESGDTAPKTTAKNDDNDGHPESGGAAVYMRTGEIATVRRTLLDSTAHMVSGTVDGALEFENELSRLS